MNKNTISNTLTKSYVKKVLDDFLKNWLNTQDFHIASKIYHETISRLLDNFLTKQERKLEELIYLSAVLLLRQKLVEKNKELKNNKNFVNLARKIKYIKRIIIDEIKKYYNEKIGIIKKSPNKQVFSKSLSLKGCLESISHYQININQKIIKKLKLVHFGVDWKIAEEGLEVEKTLDIKQAANFLSTQLRQDINEDNVLEYCLKYGFGCYVYCKKLNIETPSRRNFPEDIDDIELALTNGIISKQYSISYRGLLRLIQNSSTDVDSMILINMTVEHICHGGNIVLDQKSALFYQPSVSQYILGVPDYVTFDRTKKWQYEVSKKDLRFIEKELADFEIHGENMHQGSEIQAIANSNMQTDISESCNNSDSQNSRNHELHELLNKIYHGEKNNNKHIK